MLIFLNDSSFMLSHSVISYIPFKSNILGYSHFLHIIIENHILCSKYQVKPKSNDTGFWCAHSFVLKLYLILSTNTPVKTYVGATADFSHRFRRKFLTVCNEFFWWDVALVIFKVVPDIIIDFWYGFKVDCWFVDLKLWQLFAVIGFQFVEHNGYHGGVRNLKDTCYSAFFPRTVQKN